MAVLPSTPVIQITTVAESGIRVLEDTCSMRNPGCGLDCNDIGFRIVQSSVLQESIKDVRIRFEGKVKPVLPAARANGKVKSPV